MVLSRDLVKGPCSLHYIKPSIYIMVENVFIKLASNTQRQSDWVYFFTIVSMILAEWDWMWSFKYLH